MAGDGKHPHDSGRARYHRFLDRAQLEFDDMIIGDFLYADDDPRDAAIAHVPIRYGVTRASDPSDSAIVGAMLNAGVFEPDEDEVIAIDANIDAALEELFASEAAASAAPTQSATTNPDATKHSEAVKQPQHSPAVIRPGRASAAGTNRETSDERAHHPAIIVTPPLKGWATRSHRRPWSMRKFGQGFFIGAASTAAAIGIFSLIF